jgi:hypothetical protein
MHARSCSGGKNVCRRGITIILTDSARKKKAGKKFWRIIIKQKLTQATIFTVGWNWRKRWEFNLVLKCHCACSWEIGTCISNDAGRQAAHKKQRKARFWSNLVKRRFILMFWRYIFNSNAKKTIKNQQIQRHPELWTIKSASHVCCVFFF